eukprot:gene4684-biopygen4014
MMSPSFAHQQWVHTAGVRFFELCRVARVRSASAAVSPKHSAVGRRRRERRRRRCRGARRRVPLASHAFEMRTGCGIPTRLFRGGCGIFQNVHGIPWDTTMFRGVIVGSRERNPQGIVDTYGPVHIDTKTPLLFCNPDRPPAALTQRGAGTVVEGWGGRSGGMSALNYNDMPSLFHGTKWMSTGCLRPVTFRIHSNHLLKAGCPRLQRCGGGFTVSPISLVNSLGAANFLLHRVWAATRHRGCGGGVWGGVNMRRTGATHRLSLCWSCIMNDVPVVCTPAMGAHRWSWTTETPIVFDAPPLQQGTCAVRVSSTVKRADARYSCEGRGNRVIETVKRHHAITHGHRAHEVHHTPIVHAGLHELHDLDFMILIPLVSRIATLPCSMGCIALAGCVYKA